MSDSVLGFSSTPICCRVLEQTVALKAARALALTVTVDSILNYYVLCSILSAFPNACLTIRSFEFGYTSSPIL